MRRLPRKHPAIRAAAAAARKVRIATAAPQ